MTDDHDNHHDNHHDDHHGYHDGSRPNSQADTAASSPRSAAPRPAASGAPAGGEGNGADRDVLRAIRDAYLSPDLLRPGPGLWPFGRRARERRARDRAAAAEAQRRRHQIHTAITRSPSAAGPQTGQGPGRGRDTETRQPEAGLREAGLREPGQRVAGWRPAERRAHAVVIACLAGLVGVVVVAAVWWTGPDPHPANAPATTSPAPESSDAPSTAMTFSSAVPGTAGGSLPARPPIPPGGVDPVTPGPDTPVDPGSVRLVEPPVGDPTPGELATPEAAMRAWLARLCPFHYRDAFGQAEQRARGAMTDNGWATFNPLDGDNGSDKPDQGARASWDKTVAAHEAGRCAEPVAQVSPEAPRSATSVIVIGAITRVVTTEVTPADRAGGTAAGSEPYVEQVSAVRLVRRGADGLWRVDLPTQGG